MPEPAVQLNNLGKCYSLYAKASDKILDVFGLLRFMPWRRKLVRPFWALRNINLQVAKGERLGLIGRNGAGKSTLLKIICGNLQPTEGSLTVNGQIQALMEMGTAFHPDFTGRQNVWASLSYQGFDNARIKECEEEIEDFVELGVFFDQPVKTYSAGMYARLAFAAATSIEPDILIIDEVLGAGDAYFASKCAARMKRLTHDSGATLLFVSHDISSVQQMCNRAVWIERGQIIMDDSPFEVGKAYYAETLRLEEERLKLQNRGKVSGSLQEIQPDVMIFRLVHANGGLLASAHLIRRLTLKNAEGDYALTVHPGAPMDNDNAQAASIITTSGSLWGEPLETGDGQYVRPVTATGGADNQAAFEFVAIGLLDKQDLMLEVEHAARITDPVAVEYYYEGQYRRLGVLEPARVDNGWKISSYPLMLHDIIAENNDTIFQEGQAKPFAESILIEQTVDHCESVLCEQTEQAGISATSRDENQQPDALQQNDFVRIKQSSDKFASNFAELTSVEICGATGSQVIFSHGEDFSLNVEIKIHQKLESVYFTLGLYTLDDVVVYVGHWLLGRQLQPDDYCFEVYFQQPQLRQHEYVFSFALVDDFRAPELTYFSEWNRTHHFKINEDYFGHIGLGLVSLLSLPACGEVINLSAGKIVRQ